MGCTMLRADMRVGRTVRSHNCIREFSYAVENSKYIIPVLTQPYHRLRGKQDTDEQWWPDDAKHPDGGGHRGAFCMVLMSLMRECGAFGSTAGALDMCRFDMRFTRRMHAMPGFRCCTMVNPPKLRADRPAQTRERR
eukprot:3419267-Rhodomonas_salina.2